MRYKLFVLYVLFFATGAPDAMAQPASVDGRNPSRPAVKSLRRCGSFAILGCFSTRRAAVNYNDEIETGFVLKTHTRNFPTLKQGLFCVMKGPGSLNEARDWLQVFGGEKIDEGCQN